MARQQNSELDIFGNDTMTLIPVNVG